MKFICVLEKYLHVSPIKYSVKVNNTSWIDLRKQRSFCLLITSQFKKQKNLQVNDNIINLHDEK